MPKVQVTSQIEIDFEDMLKGVAQLESNELEQFTEKVIALRAQRRAPHLPNSEAELLQHIHQGVAPNIRQRYTDLARKLQDETLTSAEQDELVGLTDVMEEADAERMENLILLAQLRNVSVDVLMMQLGLR